jgi:integrase
MYNLILTLDKRRSRKDGSYPLVFKISAKSKARRIPTKYHCKSTDWNNRAKALKDTHPNYEVIAPHLKQLELDYVSKLMLFEKLFPKETNIQKVKDFLTKKDELVQQKATINVKAFWKNETELLRSSNRNGGAEIYDQAFNAISKVQDLEISFKEVDYNFLVFLEVSFIGKGLSINCISLYLRTFRAVFKKAIKSKVASVEDYPFSDFKIKKAPTVPRPITREEMSSFFSLNIPEGSTLFESWLMGKLTFMLQGINFKDLILLTESSIKNGRVFYSRSKTKTLYSVVMLQDVIEIFDYFKRKGASTLLGKLSDEELSDIRKLPKTIKQKNKTFNKHLKKMGDMIGCKEKITSYVFRYSYANIAKRLGYSKDMIAEALGHKYGSTVTGLYLEAYDKEQIDSMTFYVHLTVTMPETTPAL